MKHHQRLEPSICLELERGLGQLSHPGSLERVQLFPAIAKPSALIALQCQPAWAWRRQAPARAEAAAPPDPWIEQGGVRVGEPHAPTLGEGKDWEIPLPCWSSTRAGIILH